MKNNNKHFLLEILLKNGIYSKEVPFISKELYNSLRLISKVVINTKSDWYKLEEKYSNKKIYEIQINCIHDIYKLITYSKLRFSKLVIKCYSIESMPNTTDEMLNYIFDNMKCKIIVEGSIYRLLLKEKLRFTKNTEYSIEIYYGPYSGSYYLETPLMKEKRYNKIKKIELKKELKKIKKNIENPIIDFNDKDYIFPDYKLKIIKIQEILNINLNLDKDIELLSLSELVKIKYNISKILHDEKIEYLYVKEMKKKILEILYSFKSFKSFIKKIKKFDDNHKFHDYVDIYMQNIYEDLIKNEFEDADFDNNNPKLIYNIIYTKLDRKKLDEIYIDSKKDSDILYEIYDDLKSIKKEEDDRIEDLKNYLFKFYENLKDTSKEEIDKLQNEIDEINLPKLLKKYVELKIEPREYYF